MEDDKNNITSQYSKDIVLISKYLHDQETKIDSLINNEEELMYKFCNKETYFNKKGTKILSEETFNTIISILYEYTKIDDYIFLLVEKLNIYLIKSIINGYIYYNINNIEEKIFSIIQSVLPLILSHDYIYFIYNKLSKIYRQKLKEDENKEKIKASFEQFSKIFKIWKLFFNYYENTKTNERYLLLFGKNAINIKINSINEKYESTMINMQFVKPFLLDEEELILLKIYNKKENYLEIKIKDIITDNEINLSNINSISFSIEDKIMFYFINNDKKNKKEINLNNINNKEIDRIEIMKNFSGKIFSIEFIRKYNNKLGIFYRINPDKLGINIQKENKIEKFKNNYINLPDNNCQEIDENIEINLDNTIFFNSKYYPKNENFLNNIKYLGGFEAFFPLFKIIKYYLKHIENKNIIITFVKDILEIIINKIHISKYNLKNFYEIIIPLTGALQSISEDLSNKEQVTLFKNNIIYIMFTYILTAPIPNMAKYIFKEVIHLSKDILIPVIDYSDNIFEQNLSRINSFDWYCFILFIHFEINLLVYDDINKVSKIIFDNFSKIVFSLLNNKLKISDSKKSELFATIKIFVGIINYLYPNSMEGFKLFNPLKEVSLLITGDPEHKDDLSFLCLLVLKIFFELKNLNLIKNTKEDSYYSKFIELFLDLKNIFKKNELEEEEEKGNNKINLIKNTYKNNLKYYIENKDFISKILKEDIEYISYEEKKLKEFIDYKRQFRKIIKEQFMFNHFWSDKKIFFNEKFKIGRLKYKIRNYYTSNFQRPIISPILDYPFQYPSFSKYSIGDDFYLNEENKDCYNFTLESKSFEDIMERYWKINFEIIKNELKDKIYIFDVCLIKMTHHIKGKLFLEKIEKINNVYFVSYNYKEMKEIPNCNTFDKKTNLCYGSFFQCPEKDCCIKIKININDIRLIIKRIYFYRKSGLEIFTKNKSYLFNFAENPLFENYIEKIGEKNCDDFLTIINNSFKYERFPLNINNQLIGYLDLYANELRDENGNLRKSRKKNFMDYLLRHWRDNDNKYSKLNIDISTFDLIIILNLISNRSYNDLYQYPIFPLLYLYDKITGDKNNSLISFSSKPRNLTQYIGFQTETEKANNRKKEFFNLYKCGLEEKKEDKNEEDVFYFNTHYSNGVYASNFLIRIFPFSFIAIEFQGNGFDEPNRLFHSIEKNFYSISYLKTDLRELIPEFYYLPEIMINLNKLNLKQLADGNIIDNVNMPSEFNVTNKGENYGIFKFIECMKYSLEKNPPNIYKWIKLIFGEGQIYNENKKKDLLFRPESYINFNKEEEERLNNYTKNEDVLSYVELGLIPLQTIFNFNELKIDKKKSCIKIIDKNQIEKIIKDDKNYYIIDLINNQNENYINKEYLFKDNKNNNIKIINNELGKIEIYINDILISEFYDQKDIIKYIHFNKRLNMFITTSLDGYSCLYSFPNKLLNIISHPNNGYFDYILLGSNPFPFIIAYDKNNQEFYSYSLNGIYIDNIKISELIKNVNIIKIFPIFDTNGGTHIDKLIINSGKNTVFINLPFFEKDK